MKTDNTGASRAALEDDELQQLITGRIEEDSAFWTGAGAKRTVITVTVDDTEVTMTGTVRTGSERRRADLLARALGAVTVHNHLAIADGKRDARRTASAA